MKLTTKIKCQVNGVYYEKGETIEVNTVEQANKLNELGFIEPLTAKELQNFSKPQNRLERGEIL